MLHRFFTAVLRSVEAGLRFVFLLITICCIILTFFVCNRTKVIGRDNIGALWRLIRATRRGAFISATHYTMLDSWVLLFALAFPHMFWNIRRLPWSLPDRANFFSIPGVSHILRLFHTIPVDRPANARSNGARGNLRAVRTVLDVIERGEVAQVFYQGGRTVDVASLGTPKPAVMSMMLGMKAHVLPALLTGTRAVQPYRKDPGDPPATLWRSIPWIGKRLEWLFHARCGKQITIAFGEPWSATEILADLAGVPEADRVAQFSALFMERMEELRRRAEGIPEFEEAS